VEDADQFLVSQRARGLARSTIYGKAVALAQFYDFLIVRYQGDIHHLTGCVVAQPIDEFNRPPKADYGVARIPPSTREVDKLFTEWRESLPMARKYLPAAHSYLAASLWRRVGLRINETAMLDIRDRRPDLGSNGKFHVRYGKGSRRRGPKARLVPAIEQADALIEWWLTDVRHQFGDDWRDPDAPLLPSERHDLLTGRCRRASDDVLRRGLTIATSRYLPSWAGKLTPHVLRHYCASAHYERGMDLKALQDLLGHASTCASPPGASPHHRTSLRCPGRCRSSLPATANSCSSTPSATSRACAAAGGNSTNHPSPNWPKASSMWPSSSAPSTGGPSRLWSRSDEPCGCCCSPRTPRVLRSPSPRSHPAPGPHACRAPP
jgi:integrase